MHSTYEPPQFEVVSIIPFRSIASGTDVVVDATGGIVPDKVLSATQM